MNFKTPCIGKATVTGLLGDWRYGEGHRIGCEKIGVVFRDHDIELESSGR